jgi:TolB protein
VTRRPTWSPNGAQIAFTSDRSGQPQIYIMSSSDGTGLRRLTTTEAYAEQATWSASLNEIAFAGGTQSHTEIKVLELSTGNVRQITSGCRVQRTADLRAQRTPPRVHHQRNGRTHVFTIARDGKDARQITTEGNNFSPAWSQ